MSWRARDSAENLRKNLLSVQSHCVFKVGGPGELRPFYVLAARFQSALYERRAITGHVPDCGGQVS